MRQIDAIERQARLVRRHRLTPRDSAVDALEAARSVVVLHSLDPVTVFLSIHSRTSGVLPVDIERTFYDDRTLVRVLCMRRTLFAVPRELVPFVYAACTRTIAAREGFGARKRDFRLLRRRNKQLAMEHVRDLSWGASAASRYSRMQYRLS